MRIVIKLLSFTLVFAALSGCGATRGDRTVSGAAIGAGVGALGASAFGGNAGTGAIVGGLGGAAAGYTGAVHID